LNILVTLPLKHGLNDCATSLSKILNRMKQIKYYNKIWKKRRNISWYRIWRLFPLWL